MLWNSPNDISKCLEQGLVSWEGERRYLLAFLSSSLCQLPEAVSYCISNPVCGKECSCIVFISFRNPKTCFSLHKCISDDVKRDVAKHHFKAHYLYVIFAMWWLCVVSSHAAGGKGRKLFCFICFLVNFVFSLNIKTLFHNCTVSLFLIFVALLPREV